MVYRGLSITVEEAKDARKAVFNLIVKVDNSAVCCSSFCWLFYLSICSLARVSKVSKKEKD